MTNPRAQPMGDIDIETLDIATVIKVVKMVPSDHVSFDQIRELHGLSQVQVEVLIAHYSQA